MSVLNPKKLLHSKWTAIQPERKEKHFLVSELEYDDAGAVSHCAIEAVMSKRRYIIDWRDLADDQRWRQGWSSSR